VQAADPIPRHRQHDHFPVAAAIPQGAKRFYNRVTSLKSELWLPDVSQFDFYDRPGPVAAAAEAIALHFARTL
jgi:hypothetical protein